MIRWRNIIDWIAILVGLIALFCNFCFPSEEFLNMAFCVGASILGGGYILYSIWLWCRRPRFDWHLINGHFLRKVCCLVLLTPSILACLGNFIVDSEKELTYAEELYVCGEKAYIGESCKR